MRSPVKELRQLLIETPAITQFLKGNKVYRYQPPQTATAPLILLYEVSGQPIGSTLSLALPAWSRRVSVECQADAPMDVDALGDLVIDRLNGFRGTVGDLQIQDCRPVSDVYSFEDTLRRPRRIVDFNVVVASA